VGMAVETTAVRILLLLLVSLQQQSALDVGSQRELQTAPPTTSPAAARACSLSLPVGAGGLLRLRGGLLASREALHAERERQQALSASSRANGHTAVDTEGGGGGGGGGGQGSGETPKWKDMCRICYDDDNKSDLFAPCMCSGSMGLVHRECLRQWRAVKVLHETHGSTHVATSTHTHTHTYTHKTLSHPPHIRIIIIIIITHTYDISHKRKHLHKSSACRPGKAQAQSTFLMHRAVDMSTAPPTRFSHLKPRSVGGICGCELTPIGCSSRKGSHVPTCFSGA
jgi:hypothetical protein